MVLSVISNILLPRKYRKQMFFPFVPGTLILWNVYISSEKTGTSHIVSQVWKSNIWIKINVFVVKLYKSDKRFGNE